jgi:hypothetical protein|tara:strand:+ start:267 stop:794 length:528 start_codon:yes stop_codon:yes gene_type:complete
MSFEQGMERHEAEAKVERTEARKRVDAIRRERLSEDEWALNGFSPPGELHKCEHRFLRLMVLGGSPKYFCDDCEWVIILPSAYAQPKQHVVANALMEIGWVMKYDGPEAVAMGLARPHLRLDKEGHPALPPIEIVKEQAEQWAQVMGLVEEYIGKSLANGHAPEAIAEKAEDETS